MGSLEKFIQFSKKKLKWNVKIAAFILARKITGKNNETNKLNLDWSIINIKWSSRIYK